MILNVPAEFDEVSPQLRHVFVKLSKVSPEFSTKHCLSKDRHGTFGYRYGHDIAVGYGLRRWGRRSAVPHMTECFWEKV